MNPKRRKYMPGPGWFEVSPRNPGVWEHGPTGIRIHVIGVVMDQEGDKHAVRTHRFSRLYYECYRANGHNRRRAMMAWAGMVYM